MKNITFYTSIDNTPIYRDTRLYYTPIRSKHSGGGSYRKYEKLGNAKIDVFRWFLKNRNFGKRFFTAEILYIFDEWLKITALPQLFSRGKSRKYSFRL